MTPTTVYHLVPHLAPQVTHLVLGLGDWLVNKKTQAGYEPLDVAFDLPSQVNLKLDQSYISKCFNLPPNF